MTGQSRVSGRVRARGWAYFNFTLALCAGIAACGSSAGEPSAGGSSVGGSAQVDVGSSASVPTGASAGGAVEIGPGDPAGAANNGDIGNGNGVTCSLSLTNSPVFLDQMLSGVTAARGELYSWLPDAEAAQLRTDQVVLPASAPAPFTARSLQVLAANNNTGVAQVAAALLDQLGHARLAWPEPWALRVGPDGQDSGGRLLRVVLKPEAWVAVLKGGGLTVLNLQNQPVLASDAATTPERIGAIFNERDSFESGPSCNGMSGGAEPGFRQFIVGNPSMVQEWSLGTQQILNRLQANITQLSEFLVSIRSCPDQSDQELWNQQVLCNWDAQIQLPVTEQVAYHQALASPTTDYLGAPPQLGAMIEKLQGDLFTPDPMVVTTGSP